MVALRIPMYLCFVSCSLSYVDSVRYEPTWESLDSRPLPSWYDEAKIGIFVYWGVFSVPSFHGEFLWWDWKGDQPVKEVEDYMQKNYPPDFTYADFASMFSAEFYNPDQWADLFNASGARYVVFNSKHPDGFTNWPSKYSFNWNSVDVGPSKDLVGMLADSIRRRTNLHFGLIYSLFEWFNPLFMQDEANGFQTDDYVARKGLPELYDIVNRYKPELVWSDCDWLANDTYWKSKDFLAWLYNDSPVKDTVVTNDRWGIGCWCQHGGYLTCADRYNPGTLQKRKWENALTLDKKAWGYRREAKLEDYLTMEDLTQLIAETVR
ncbi:hypothetical protein CHS0354_021724 [Potamilus streckersoni]|uniref:alpha-L-fucosidase n=1 Tax=Potamilus streckersoni TaxID=2493646 RepID=A0AAE0TKM2_9BIVA|nr:hypothetical protein CHS0354_021724 [Potamilus streckersoni]